jgi:hypothetical protein
MASYCGFLTLARWITKYGVPVVPAFSGERFSRIPGWPELATTDDAQLQKWNDENDYFNVIAVAKKGAVASVISMTPPSWPNCRIPCRIL